MRAVVQRVRSASVCVEGLVRGKIDGGGLLVYLGVARGDGPADAAYLADKIAGLRIFPDEEGRMNRSLAEYAEKTGRGGGVLAISQFTLLADARKGRRPSCTGAEDPEPARSLYDYFMEQIRGRRLPCEGGIFQAHMEVESINDGPVTILLDSKKLF